MIDKNGLIVISLIAVIVIICVFANKSRKKNYVVIEKSDNENEEDNLIYNDEDDEISESKIVNPNVSNKEIVFSSNNMFKIGLMVGLGFMVSQIIFVAITIIIVMALGILAI